MHVLPELCNFEAATIIDLLVLVFVSLFALWFIRPYIERRSKDDDGENEITKSFIEHETKVILMMSLTLNFQSLMTHKTDWTLKHIHWFFLCIPSTLLRHLISAFCL